MFMLSAKEVIASIDYLNKFITGFQISRQICGEKLTSLCLSKLWSYLNGMLLNHENQLTFKSYFKSLT